MDTTQWTQDIGLVTSMGAEIAPPKGPEKKVRPQKEQLINCPRCNSTNTKFCYYNNYSLTQPRYFCKTCRRYWTEGGTLRNVPVGGGSRKNRRISSSSNSQKQIPDLNPNYNQNLDYKTNLGLSSQHLNLGFPGLAIHDHGNYFHGVSQFPDQLPKMEGAIATSTSNSTPVSALDLLRTEIASRGLASFISSPTPDLNGLYTTSGFPFQELLKPGAGADAAATSSFSSSGVHQENNIGGKMMMFPFGCLKQFSGTSEAEQQNNQSKGQENPSAAAGYWNGMLGGGSW